MAELNTATSSGAGKMDIKGKKGAGVKKGKKMSTRVDLTPMVDLGFLLITFFMFTTTMTRLTSMNLKMPDDNRTTEQDIKKSGALTIWLGDKDRLYFYEGTLLPDLSNVRLSDYRQIRQNILAKKAALPDKDDLFVIIMPGNNSTYKNIIDILDELSIDRVARYALVNKVDPAYSDYITKMDLVASSSTVTPSSATGKKGAF
jgi:biopolymer transport protein ExbD